MDCNPIATYEFAATADKPYEMDWVEWLEGATLTGASVTISSALTGLVTTHDLDFSVNGFTAVRVWVRGLDAGSASGFITVQITTSDSRVDARSWLFNVCG